MLFAFPHRCRLTLTLTRCAVGCCLHVIYGRSGRFLCLAPCPWLSAPPAAAHSPSAHCAEGVGRCRTASGAACLCRGAFLISFGGRGASGVAGHPRGGGVVSYSTLLPPAGCAHLIRLFNWGLTRLQGSQQRRRPASQQSGPAPLASSPPRGSQPVGSISSRAHCMPGGRCGWAPLGSLSSPGNWRRRSACLQTGPASALDDSYSGLTSSPDAAVGGAMMRGGHPLGSCTPWGTSLAPGSSHGAG